MRRQFNYLSFISFLLRFSPRQLTGEVKTADFLVSYLRKNGIDCYRQYFKTKVPLIKKAVLKLDGVKIPCQGCCFVGGKITSKEFLISSLVPSRFFLEKPNINFNPEAPSISCSNFYFAPAVAVASSKLPLIFKARKIEGEVAVQPVKHKTANILVGNQNNPKFICFAHYDSINKGAVDNASGVAVIMEAILRVPATLKNTLYVFSANEELSYEKPVYWGYGFRAFEKKFFELLKKAKKIIVVDCVGNGQPNWTCNPVILQKVFPIKNSGKLQSKIFSLHGDIEKLMRVYHSDSDDIKQLNGRFLERTTQVFLRQLC